MADKNLEEESQTLREELEKAKETISRQRHELHHLNDRNEERNRELDALHYVWCDGGCSTGVHRWTENTVTEELVQAAERNTKRLRSWLNNYKAKQSRTSGD